MSAIKILRLPSPYPFESCPYLVEPLTEEEGGGYLISLPDVPGCMSDGSTEAERSYECLRVPHVASPAAAGTALASSAARAWRQACASRRALRALYRSLSKVVW